MPQTMLSGGERLQFERTIIEPCAILYFAILSQLRLSNPIHSYAKSEASGAAALPLAPLRVGK